MVEAVAASDGTNYAMIGIVGAFLGLSWIAVSLRFYVRGFMIKALGWDDWLMMVALTFFTLEASFLIYIAWVEIDKGLEEVKRLSKLMTYVVLEIAFYICTSIFLKLSLAVFFLRVVIERWQRWVIYISVAIYTTYTVNYLFVAVFQCGNPEHFFIRRLEGKCIGWNVLAPMNYVHGSLSAITDWIFAILPIFVLRKTKIPLRTKISVAILMALGALGSVASLVRLAYIDGLNAEADDYFQAAVDIAIASNIEPGLGIVAGSLATLRPLLRTIMERTRISVPSEDNTPEYITKLEPMKIKTADPEGGDVELESFASYGYSEKFDKLESTTATTVTGSESSSGGAEDMTTEGVCTEGR